MAENLLSAAAKRKESKAKGLWKTLSTIGNRGKTTDIKFSETDGIDASQVVNREKHAGNPSSATGFALGDVTKQNFG